MPSDPVQQELQRLPAITELLKTRQALAWLDQHPRELVTEAFRQAVNETRHRIVTGQIQSIDGGASRDILASAERWLNEQIAPRLRHAINATGIILHTGLGRAVFPQAVVESMLPELTGYATLAVDRESGERLERDEILEPLLTQLTGAESATLVNNNAAATMLVLASLASGREVIVSRGQLIEIGGSFRLPEVMAQSQARLVEVGATNRTHRRDYEQAITPNTAALMRVHPSNYRVVGFTSEVELATMAELAHARGLICIDDLGAGALVDLCQFGLPHEPTVRESINAGADVVLFSGDKLIGASQCGIIVGRKDLIRRLRKHPLMRALRVDKTCVMVLERTLQLFRDPERLRQDHPTYRMLSTSLPALEQRAKTLLAHAQNLSVGAKLQMCAGEAYLGSGSLPTQSIPSVVVSVSAPNLAAHQLARRLRMDEACVFSRIEADRVMLDMRTITDAQVITVAETLARAVGRTN